MFTAKSVCFVSDENMFNCHNQYLNFLYKHVLFTQIHGRSSHFKLPQQLLNACVKHLGHSQDEQSLLRSIEQELRLSASKLHHAFETVGHQVLNNFFFSLAFDLNHLPVPEDELEHSVRCLNGRDAEQQEISSIRVQEELYSLPNYSLKTLFKRLTIPTVIEFFKAIILERQIIVFGQNQTELIYICETMLSFIYPLKWKCTYVSYMPS